MSDFNKLVLYQRFLPVISLIFLGYVSIIIYRYVVSKLSGKELRNVALIFLVALVLRFYGHMVMSVPEYMYTAMGNVIAETGRYGMCFGEFYCFPAYKPYTLFTSFLGLLFRFFENNLFTARFLNMLVGALTVFPLAVLEKNFSKRLNYVLPSLLAFFPGHIIISASMESYVFLIFFMAAALALIYDSSQEYLPRAAMVSLAAFVSKPFAFVLFIPLVIRGYRSREIFFDRWRESLTFLFYCISFFPIYYLFVFLHRDYVPGLLVGESIFRAVNVFGGNVIGLFFLIPGIASFLYGFFREDTRTVSMMLLVMFVALIPHSDTKPFLWMPFISLSVFEAGMVVSKILDSWDLEISGMKLIAVLIVGLVMVVPIYDGGNYVFEEEARLERMIDERRSKGRIAGIRRSDLLNSVSDAETLSLTLYRFEGNSSRVYLFTSERCENVDVENMEDYVFNGRVDVDSKYRFCEFVKSSG